MDKRRLYLAKWVLMLTALVLGFVVTPLSGATDGITVIDQEQTNQWLTNDLAFYAPVGQEFTPTLSGLDAVELRILGWIEPSGPLLEVNIRLGSIDGPIVATSYPFAPTGFFVGYIRFDFPGLVRLEPGQRYVIELVDISGLSYPDALVNFQSRGEDQADYPGGRRIMSGVPDVTSDLVFREGLASALPKTKDYCRKGLWSVLTRPDGSTFKNQGDCIQYVNTGK